VDRRPPSDLDRPVIPNRQNALTTLASTSVDQTRPRDEISGLGKGETYSDLAIGFGIATTVFRYKRQERHPRRGNSRGLEKRSCPA
jgi:hypothetical protein